MKPASIAVRIFNNNKNSKLLLLECGCCVNARFKFFLCLFLAMVLYNN